MVDDDMDRCESRAVLELMAEEVAHAIYNPLSELKGFASMLSRRLHNDPDRDYIEHVVGATKNIEAVVNGFLRYAKPLSLNLSSIKTHRFLDICFKHHPRVQLERGCYETSLDLKIDVLQMSLAVTNLIASLNLHTPTHQTLHVSVPPDPRVSSPGGIWRLSIANPSTINCDDCADALLFEPFYTVQKTGAGLSLAVAHRIIEAHHGSLRVQIYDAVPGKFIVELPSA